MISSITSCSSGYKTGAKLSEPLYNSTFEDVTILEPVVDPGEDELGLRE
jgi:hypothetical protein